MAVVIPDRVRQQLDKWRSDLLLVDGRSSLIDLPKRSSLLKLGAPGAPMIYPRLQNGRVLTIYLPDDDPGQLDLLDPSLDGEESIRLLTGSDQTVHRITDDQIIIDGDQKKLPSLLYRLRLRAQSALNERGVNLLFAAFGVLQWKEAEQSDRQLRSPLVLVPVDLIRQSAQKLYQIRLLDDETVVNPLLVERLQRDFEIDLTEELNEIDDAPFETLFDCLAHAVRFRRSWAVQRDSVYLGLFSFLKMGMYKELEAHAQLAAQNPIISRLCGVDVPIDRPAGLLAASELDDKLPARDCRNVQDADASQQEVIVAAKAGANLVVQGPPGTGKSQTITNIIAECVATGKTVLFVSEKAAALDVVYGRLRKSGLADLCLRAHSHTANKQEIIRELGAALKRADEGMSAISDDGLINLESVRGRLNAYVRALHADTNPLRMSAYAAHGRVAHLVDAPTFAFPFAGIESITPERLVAIEEILQGLVTSADVLRAGTDHPWYGCAVRESSLERREQIESRFQRLTDNLQLVESQSTALANQLEIVSPSHLMAARELRLILRWSAGRIPLGVWVPSSEKVAPEQILQGLVARASDSSMTPGSLARGRVLAVLREGALQSLLAGSMTGDEIATERTRLIQILESLRSNLARVQTLQSDFETRIGRNSGATLDAARANVALAELLQKNPRAVGIWFDPVGLAQATELAQSAEEHSRIWKEDGAKIQERFAPEIFDLASALLARYRRYASILRFGKPSYWHDRGTIQRLSRGGGKRSVTTTLTDLQEASRIAASRTWLQERRDDLTSALGIHYLGESTSWAEVQDALATTRAVVQSLGSQSPSAEIVEIALTDGLAATRLGDLHRGLFSAIQEAEKDLASACAILHWCRSDLDHLSIGSLLLLASGLRDELSALWRAEDEIRGIAAGRSGQEFRDALDQIDADVEFVGTIFPVTSALVGGRDLDQISFESLVESIQRRLERIDDLEGWITFKRSEARAGQLGLDGLLPVLAITKAPPATWTGGVLRALYKRWLDARYAKAMALQEFLGSQHDQAIQQFRELDRRAITLAARRVRNAVIARSPRLGGMPTDRSEMGILVREVNRHGRHKPLRRLFREIPTLLLALKPCLMMSPLSVSQYLDPERLRFDVVIFDEASQVRPEDAVGAIMRGRQVIVAGDQHQLPPTSFFTSITANPGEEEDDAPEIYESILEACLTAQIELKMLRWHYRSRDERLIAFSNRFIYDRQLVTFPSPHQNNDDQGVRFEHVPEGVYDRKGTRANIIEAQRVVELIVAHAERWIAIPGRRRSLGVVAFSEAQQLAILQLLEQRRRSRSELEAFFGAQQEEFFVKNLESVQGDERDVIIFSIGYGRDASGNLSLNFGPLNRNGGERRLNVAVTRARYLVTVVSSITGDDIDEQRTQADGMRLLKRYLQYAERGVSVLEWGVSDADGDYESPFEQAVAEALQRKGLRVQSQIGCAGFRVDLGIVHPDKPGRFVLGIECDGATYHSSATARDRDRLRQEVLQGLGWRIHRIWSRDWVRSPVQELEKALAAYRDALSQIEVEQSVLPETKAGPTLVEFPFKAEPPRAAHVSLPEPHPVHKQVYYQAVALPRQGRKDQFYDAPKESLVAAVRHCVQAEGPIATRIVYRRVAAAWEIERAGSRVARRIDGAIAEAIRRGNIVCREDFLWPADLAKPVVRRSGDGENTRSIDDVCPEEIDEALLIVLRQDFAAAETNLIVATARLLGYDRAAHHVQVRIADRIARLVQRGALERNGEQIRESVGRARQTVG